MHKCNLYTEKQDHILQCRIPSRQAICDQWKKEIDKFLSKPHTPPAVKHYFCQGISQWLEKGPYTPMRYQSRIDNPKTKAMIYFP
jgi:hypothetical protein